MSQSMKRRYRDVKMVTIPIRRVWEEFGEAVFVINPAVSQTLGRWGFLSTSDRSVCQASDQL